MLKSTLSGMTERPRRRHAIHWSCVRLVQPKAVLIPGTSMRRTCTRNVPMTITMKKEFLVMPSKTFTSLWILRELISLNTCIQGTYLRPFSNQLNW